MLPTPSRASPPTASTPSTPTSGPRRYTVIQDLQTGHDIVCAIPNPVDKETAYKNQWQPRSSVTLSNTHITIEYGR